MKKLLALLLVLTMVAALGTTAFADDAKVGKTVLKVAFNQSSANPEYAVLEEISDDLYDATEGRYSLEIYPDASLGDQAQTLEMVMIGALDMSLVGNAIIEPYSSDFAIIATPYVYDSIDHQEKVFESNDDALKALYATTEDHGFVVLSTYSLGARNLYTRDGPVTTPEELKGLKIRVMGSDTCLNMMNAMGGSGVAMAQGDVYSAIQTKTLDGAENNINYTGHLLLPDELVISKMILDQMSPEDQAALRKVCEDSIPYAFDLVAEAAVENQKKGEELGVTFSEADIPAFQALCQDLIKENAEKSDITKGMYELILSLRETDADAK